MTRTCHPTFAIASHERLARSRTELKNQNIGYRQYGQESFGGDLLHTATVDLCSRLRFLRHRFGSRHDRHKPASLMEAIA
jgi:hypothetical protein